MAAVFKVDTTDLSIHLRVNQGDGLDPYSTSGLEPQFSENAAGEGEPLISLNEGNREQMFPVILNPARAGAPYTATKDSLHQLIRDVNRTLKAAKTIEWRDDGATNSTFSDVQFAKFEPAYDFRRAGQLWVPGVVHVWTAPYGHTGTSRIAATGATSMPIVQMSIASGALDGDVEAVSVYTYGATIAGTPSSFIGVSVLPAGMHALWLPHTASLTASGMLEGGSGATVMGASGAIASRAVRAFAPATGLSGTLNVAAEIDFRTSSLEMPPGRHRLLAAVRFPAATLAGSAVAMTAFLDTYFGATQVLDRTRDWSLLDFGAFSIATDPQHDTKIQLRAQVLGASPGATAPVDFAAVMVLPEDSTLLGQERPGNTNATVTLNGLTGLCVETDGTATQVVNAVDFTNTIRGVIPQIPVGSGRDIIAFALPDNGAQNQALAVEVRCRERFTFAR